MCPTVSTGSSQGRRADKVEKQSGFNARVEQVALSVGSVGRKFAEDVISARRMVLQTVVL